ncbi:NTP transferase domain-containing protein [Candidatus Uhrbacteria bacterium]|nr:NTP transferase domain-containing protein [Candidatus Uhrbacteria bacterium]
MKGVILAGGSGTRLKPLTTVTSKQLLPVYDHPMIYYPLMTLIGAGIRDILVITAPEHADDYYAYLGNGKDFGVRFSYAIQKKPAGLSQALGMAKRFVGKDSVTMILGDNIFGGSVAPWIRTFNGGAMIFVKKVRDPGRFGVVELGQSGSVRSIEEKPKHPKSHFAQTGLYVYDNSVFSRIATLKPSARGELEITDLNNLYLVDGALRGVILQGEWIDAGTFDALLKANQLIARQRKKFPTRR